MSHLIPRPLTPVPVELIAGPDRRRVIDAALDSFPLRGDQLLALANSDLVDSGLARDVAAALRAKRHRVEALAAPDTTTGSWARTLRTNWAAIDVGQRAGRLERVHLPSKLAHAASIIALNSLQTEEGGRPPLALGMWADFAHPRQRTGARWSDLRDGLTAEIALAVRPQLVLLFHPWRDLNLVVATSDQIAAELAALSILQLVRSPDDEPVGPWEHPLVQRATELELGVTSPGAIAGRSRWVGDPGLPIEDAFASFARRVFARFGVEIG
jgi:hypothetical protein